MQNLIRFWEGQERAKRDVNQDTRGYVWVVIEDIDWQTLPYSVEGVYTSKELAEEAVKRHPDWLEIYGPIALQGPILETKRCETCWCKYPVGLSPGEGLKYCRFCGRQMACDHCFAYGSCPTCLALYCADCAPSRPLNEPNDEECSICHKE